MSFIAYTRELYDKFDILAMCSCHLMLGGEHSEADFERSLDLQAIRNSEMKSRGVILMCAAYYNEAVLFGLPCGLATDRVQKMLLRRCAD